MIAVKCGECGNVHKIKDGNEGKKFNCRQCSAPVKVSSSTTPKRNSSKKRRAKPQEPEYVDYETDDYESYDSYDDDYEDYDEAYTPSRTARSRKSSGKKKPKRMSRSGRSRQGNVPVSVIAMILVIAAINMLGLVMANEMRAAVRSIVGLCGNGLMLILVLIPTRPTWYIARALALLGLIGCLLGGAGILMVLSRLPVGLAVLALGELGIGAGLILGIFLSLGSDDSRGYYGF